MIDIKQGWMKTESRNLEWTGILSIVERQKYQSSGEVDKTGLNAHVIPIEDPNRNSTDVTTTVTLVSRFGQARILAQRRKEDKPTAPSDSSVVTDDNAPPRKGFFSTWSTSSLQRTIEHVGLRRTRDALVKSKDGMNVVLERLRLGGLVAVLDGMRRDRDAAFGRDNPWKQA